jgi:iron complex transport system permease protein
MNARPQFWLAIAGLTLLLAIVVGFALAAGPTFLTAAEWRSALTGPADDPLRIIVWEIRVPRIVLGLLIGGVLGLSGAAMQGFLKNPLSDPGVLGVSAGAASGAVLAFYTGLAGTAAWALPAGGMAGALFVAVLLPLLAGRDAAVHTLVLAGLALNAFFGALTTLALNLSPNPFANMEVMFWLLGSLTDRGWNHVMLALPFLAAGSLLLLLTGPALRALSLGDDTAESLGFSHRRTRWFVIAGTALSVGAAVSVSGVIGFIGLIVPHLLRGAAKGDPQRLLILSAIGGAVFLTAADTFVRVIHIGPELKLGVVTALLGAPFFLGLLARLRRELP